MKRRKGRTRKQNMKGDRGRGSEDEGIKRTRMVGG